MSIPVQADVNRSIVTGEVDGIMCNLRDVRYSFTTWLAYEILLVRSGHRLVRSGELLLTLLMPRCVHNRAEH